MKGSGRSEAIIDRLHALHPKLIDLSLGRLEILLAKLGHPERALPPVDPPSCGEISGSRLSDTAARRPPQDTSRRNP